MPRPFTLQVPPPSKSPVHFRQGDLLTFKVNLFHQAEDLLPYIIVAVQRSFEMGVGNEVKGKLQRVVAEHPEGEAKVFDGDEGIVSTKLPKVSAEEVMGFSGEQIRRVGVRFVTPTRIDLFGKLQNPITFVGLVKAANERGRALFWAYEGREPHWDGKFLVKEAEKVEMVGGEQVWVESQRYSRRQQEKMKVGGVIGWAEFEGENLSVFVPLLRLMEWVHVGKLGTMGLGQIAVTAAPKGELEIGATKLSG